MFFSWKGYEDDKETFQLLFVKCSQAAFHYALILSLTATHFALEDISRFLSIIANQKYYRSGM